MKAIIEFELPEDQVEFEIATQGSAMHSVLWDMDQWLRGQTKYASDDISEDTYNAFKLCREHLRSLINENNINV
tara:strand:- start:7754 stop:7975 length:222 start_codon:yes stop_codon:yes gene_type:complete